MLNALLARHSAHLSNAAAGTAERPTAHRTGRHHRHRSSTDDASPLIGVQGPPSKIAEAVRRGVNPLMIGTNLHLAEEAARQRAKGKRARDTSEVTSDTPTAPASRRTTASSTARDTPGNKAPQKPVETPRRPPLPINQSREEPMSRTLAARHRELRAQQQEEEHARQQPASTSASSPALPADKMRSASGASGISAVGRLAAASSNAPALQERKGRAMVGTAKTRRNIWRRQCTTLKTLRLTRGVSRAAGLRRYWYTTLDADVVVPTASQQAADEAAEKGVVPSSFSLTTDGAEVRCARRRRRAARRHVLADFHARAAAQKLPDAAVSATATSMVDERNAKATSTASLPRLTRRRYKAALRSELDGFGAAMWGVAVRVVRERRGILNQLTASCANAATNTGKDGVLPLLLARHFPLFGAQVEVQELELRAPRVSSRSTRHRRRARYADSTEEEGQSDVAKASESSAGPSLRVLQRHIGIIVEDYHNAIGVLLLPPSGAGQAAWAAAVAELCGDTLQALQEAASSPRVVRVPKHFPGASGAFAELLPSLLALTASRKNKRDKDMRVLSAIFTGEVDQDGGASSVAAAYPLTRLLNRCL